MKLTSFGKVAIATSTIAVAALFSMLSVESAQAQPRRLYVTPHYYYNPYVADQSGLPWYAVRAFYAGGPWSGFNAAPFSWNGWDDYAQRNGIGCTPGSVIKGGDGIMYVCQ
jgi:hypothetical protein